MQEQRVHRCRSLRARRRTAGSKQLVLRLRGTTRSCQTQAHLDQPVDGIQKASSCTAGSGSCFFFVFSSCQTVFPHEDLLLSVQHHTGVVWCFSGFLFYCAHLELDRSGHAVVVGLKFGFVCVFLVLVMRGRIGRRGAFFWRYPGIHGHQLHRLFLAQDREPAVVPAPVPGAAFGNVRWCREAFTRGKKCRRQSARLVADRGPKPHIVLLALEERPVLVFAAVERRFLSSKGCALPLVLRG
mmetsp:Transcript_7731/g.18690  ORF Transcript_7731/g.18690 Transcript_7731/m.18690 type:complete len:241 (+) Transcript_7731:348-1070(+)